MPGVIAHIIVGSAGRYLGPVDRLAFDLLQLELGAEQLGLDLRAQVAGLVAGFQGRALQHFLRLGQHGGHIVDEPLAAVFGILGHGELLFDSARQVREAPGA